MSENATFSHLPELEITFDNSLRQFLLFDISLRFPVKPWNNSLFSTSIFRYGRTILIRHFITDSWKQLKSLCFVHPFRIFDISLRCCSSIRQFVTEAPSEKDSIIHLKEKTHLFVILKLLENTVLYRTMNLIKSKAEICLDQFLRYGSRRVSLIYLIKLHYSTFRYGLPKMPDITIFYVVSWFRYFVTVCSFIRHFITVFSKPLK